MSNTIKQNIRLEKFQESDFQLYFDLVNNIDVMQMITERTLSILEAQTEFSQLLSNNDLDERLGSYKILDQQTDSFVGLAKLELNSSDCSSAELGYMLLPEHWGKGIASQVAIDLIQKAKTHPNLEHIIAIIDPANIPSRKILIKNGFYSQEFKDFNGLDGEVLALNL